MSASDLQHSASAAQVPADAHTVKTRADAASPARSNFRTVQIDMNLISFSQKVVQVKAGELIRFVLRNTSDIPHEFTIGTAVVQEGRRAILNEMTEAETLVLERPEEQSYDGPNAVLVLPGEEKVLFWKFTDTQDLEFGCNLPGHYEMGMRGDFDVDTVQADISSRELNTADDPESEPEETALHVSRAESTPEPTAVQEETAVKQNGTLTVDDLAPQSVVSAESDEAAETPEQPDVRSQAVEVAETDETTEAPEEPGVQPQPIEVAETDEAAENPGVQPQPVEVTETDEAAEEPDVQSQPVQVTETDAAAEEPDVQPQSVEVTKTDAAAEEPGVQPQPVEVTETDAATEEPDVQPQSVEVTKTDAAAEEPDVQSQPVEVTETDEATKMVEPLKPVMAATPKTLSMTTSMPSFGVLQLAAQRSKNAARKSWRRLVRRHARVLAGKRYFIIRANLGRNGIFYRLRVGGFGSRAELFRACAAIKRRGDACIRIPSGR